MNNAGGADDEAGRRNYDKKGKRPMTTREEEGRIFKKPRPTLLSQEDQLDQYSNKPLRIADHQVFILFIS